MWKNSEFTSPFAATSMGAADGALLRVSIYSLVYNGRRRRRLACLCHFKHIAYISRNR